MKKKLVALADSHKITRLLAGMAARLLTHILFALIAFYRYFIAGLLGPCCRFEPSCSLYARAAIKKYGIKGGWLIIKRLLRCHPWHAGGFDPIE
jgi:uncharacterized protein